MSRVTSRASARRRRQGLPAEATSFVGRRHEMAEVRRLLSESRMVTLTGVGGVGKSRLASRVGAELQRAFPDGMWLIELSEVRSPDQLLQTIAEVLELPTETSPPTRGMLVDHL